MQTSWLAGTALSTPPVEAVYAVIPELGLNTTEFGKTILYFIRAGSHVSIAEAFFIPKCSLPSAGRNTHNKE